MRLGIDTVSTGKKLLSLPNIKVPSPLSPAVKVFGTENVNLEQKSNSEYLFALSSPRSKIQKHK